MKILELMAEQDGDSESSPRPITQSDLQDSHFPRARRAPHHSCLLPPIPQEP